MPAQTLPIQLTSGCVRRRSWQIAMGVQKRPPALGRNATFHHSVGFLRGKTNVASESWRYRTLGPGALMVAGRFTGLA
jgi:hypothetical protein